MLNVVPAATDIMNGVSTIGPSNMTDCCSYDYQILDKYCASLDTVSCAPEYTVVWGKGSGWGREWGSERGGRVEGVRVEGGRGGVRVEGGRGGVRVEGGSERGGRGGVRLEGGRGVRVGGRREWGGTEGVGEREGEKRDKSWR